jgi:hypothetical protein
MVRLDVNVHEVHRLGRFLKTCSEYGISYGANVPEEIINMNIRRINMALIVVVVAALFVPGILSTAHADTVSSVTNGGVTSLSGYWGETVTTIAGGPWDALALNFYASSGAPEAVGDVYLLSQQYLGTPSNLSSSTPGFIAEGTASGGFYDFANGVTVLGGTEYWVYTDAALILTGDAVGNEYYYDGGGATSAFNAFPGRDINYTLTGSLVTTPEPGTSSLLLIGVASLGLMIVARKRISPSHQQAT